MTLPTASKLGLFSNAKYAPLLLRWLVVGDRCGGLSVNRSLSDRLERSVDCRIDPSGLASDAYDEFDGWQRTSQQMPRM
jgi:hypothetical protein